MKFIDRIFDVFSRRPEVAVSSHEVPEQTRRRIFLWVESVYSNERGPWYGIRPDNYSGTFWKEVHELLQHRHGRYTLTGHQRISCEEDAKLFLLKCEPESFLDFLEYIFRVNCFFHVGMPKDEVVEELNEVLRVDDLPYYVTRYIEREAVREETQPGPIALGGGGTYIETVAFPKVILRDNEAIHKEAMVPALQLLERPSFSAANSEFLRALEDYRKGDWADCLAKCCSAFESSMKVICSENRWGYQDTDTASKLIKIILQNTSLPAFFEQSLISIATLRNKLSSAHGGGSAARSPSRPIAHYAVNSTAAAIVFLAEETGLK